MSCKSKPVFRSFPASQGSSLELNAHLQTFNQKAEAAQYTKSPALDLVKSINMQRRFIKNTSQPTKSSATSQQSMRRDYRILTCLLAAFRARRFSIVGKRGGFSDKRGTLFFDIARIIRQKQPRILLLENVKGLLSHYKGQTFHTIITTLDELGYDVQWQVLNSKDFGVSQNRERVFIVGHLGGISRPQIFPFCQSNETGLCRSAQRNAYCLQAGGDKHRSTCVEVGTWRTTKMATGSGKPVLISRQQFQRAADAMVVGNPSYEIQDRSED